jgi:hypothetical protein
MAFEGNEAKRKLPDWFPKDYAPDVLATKSPDLPAARQFVARAKRLTAEQVEAMAPAHVLLLYIMGMYNEHRDNTFRCFYLPPPQALALFDKAEKQLIAAPSTEGQVAARLFLPALGKVISAQTRLERNLVTLRIVEALRIHAAAHNGQLPDKLNEVTEVPIPNDPGTGKPFEYSREGDVATLISRVPGDLIPNSGVRYRVTIRKK